MSLLRIKENIDFLREEQFHDPLLLNRSIKLTKQKQGRTMTKKSDKTKNRLQIKINSIT